VRQLASIWTGMPVVAQMHNENLEVLVGGRGVSAADFLEGLWP